MGSGSASNEFTSPSSSVSGPRFNETTEANFEQATLRVGRYRILSELGRGGMSNVYLAVARGPGGVNKLVVLKALLPDLSTEPYALSMFLDEARLAAQLNHPNVVQTYEVGTEGDRHVIVMEYLEGQSFSATVRRAEREGSPLPVPLQIRIIINALEGLHYAHELCAYDGAPLALVHRDISPQNVFVTYDGQVKVLDFGIAKATSSSTHTATGVLKGKIAYMAPEQIIAESVDRRADIYSIGCMLWATAAGRKLWKDTPDVHIMRRAINGELPTPQSVNPRCDDELNRIVMKALATNPDDRYQTALDLQHDLELHMEQLTGIVKQKEIARYVSELFADTRAQLKALVERQLSMLPADDSSSFSREHARDHTPVPGGSSTLRDAASSYVPTQVAGQVTPGRRRWPWFMVTLGLLLGGGFYARTELLPPPVEPTASRATALPTAAPPPTATPPTRVSISLRAQPAEAKLYLDGKELPSNPTTTLLPPDDKIHEFRAEAPGFVEATTQFSPTRDSALELSLARAERNSEDRSDSRPGPRRVGGGRVVRPATGTAATANGAATAAATAQAAAQKPDCDQPFFLDKDGIRRVRAECR
jgi:serine/threonine-protein kinase